MTSIDLNADVGEMSPELDARIIEVVSSVSIACGGHAGDDASMAVVAGFAAERGVRIGAHPSYVDRENFGRARMQVAPATLRSQLRDQIQRLSANSPAPIAYVKPHGALYHAAAEDPHVAQVLVEAADGLPLMGQPGAHYVLMAEEAILEAFADRAYTADGRLLARSEPGAVLPNEDQVMDQVTGIANGRVRTHTGIEIDIGAHSICLHSDTPGAADLAHRIAARLRAHGIEIRA